MKILDSTFTYLKILLTVLSLTIFSVWQSRNGILVCNRNIPVYAVYDVIFTMLGKKSLFMPIMHFLDSVAPTDSVNLIKEVLNEVIIFEHGGLMAVFGFCVTVFSPQMRFFVS